MRIVYIADDGTEFTSKEACEAHERIAKIWEFVPGQAAWAQFLLAFEPPWLKWR